jgi:hypothetical protein
MKSVESTSLSIGQPLCALPSPVHNPSAIMIVANFVTVSVDNCARSLEMSIARVKIPRLHGVSYHCLSWSSTPSR